jgi:hypothetical protein
MAVQSYRSKVRLAGWLAGAGAVGTGALAGRIVRSGPPGVHFWLVFPLLLVVCVLAFAACVPWWRRMDDMHRTGHLVSWYWGSIAGMAIAVMAITAATGTGSQLSKGAMYVVAGEALGFLVLLGIRQLRLRAMAA